jgi:methylase of polypeptide subunit release factors
MGCQRKSVGGTALRWFHQKTVRWKEGAPSVVVERDLLCHHHSSNNQDEEQTPEHDNKKPWDAVRVDDATRVTTATRHIQSGKALIYVGDYHNARQLMAAIKGRVVPNSKYNNNASSSMTITDQWEAQRWINRERSRKKNFLLIQVEKTHELSSAIRRAPNTVVRPILNSAFGERNEPYLIPLREVLGMIGAHEWYKKGVFIPQIDNFIYPHYGVFAPTRREYLDLIDNATVPSSSNKHGLIMLEIGVGTGVISAMMLLHQKVNKVIGTDINPNAIACAKDNLARLGLLEQVELVQTSLFPVLEKDVKVDLIVCNPPWLPGKADLWLDQAVYMMKATCCEIFYCMRNNI